MTESTIGRGDLAVLDAGGGDEGERAHGDRLLVGRGQDQREDEVVPAEDEGQEARGRDAGAGQRQGDPGEGSPARNGRRCR